MRWQRMLRIWRALLIKAKRWQLQDTSTRRLFSKLYRILTDGQDLLPAVCGFCLCCCIACIMPLVSLFFIRTILMLKFWHCVVDDWFVSWKYTVSQKKYTTCGIIWYQFVRNNDVRRLTKQPKLTAIIQSCRLTLFGHNTRINDSADAKRILLASPPADWRRQPGRPHITWLSTVQQDLKQHHLTLPEAADLDQNCPLWRMMSSMVLRNLWVACQKRRRLGVW